ncbi:Tigger transposable element-derived protein 6 [Araneus ventricosus]|uniref:Tigger transposable element-derived protein 6 n=1 Tax=Araneus ventricosus TaxID=182803 RepID=A0A4Y2U4M9_ARAVE|nr:Tigger transposable element-derived protein 6 [Araneus ventricosus]
MIPGQSIDSLWEGDHSRSQSDVEEWNADLCGANPQSHSDLHETIRAHIVDQSRTGNFASCSWKMSKRKCSSIEEKNLILNEVDKGVKKKDIALKFGLPPNSLSTIIKNRDKIQNYDSSNSCSKRLKTCVYEDVDKAVLKWIHTMRDKNVPIFGAFIIEKALQFAKALGYNEVRGSNGWLEKFKRRHGIMAKVISGENKDVDDNENWIRRH